LSALQGNNDEIGKNAILKLMDAVDEYIPDPVRQLDKPFLMPIEDVFSIQVILFMSYHYCSIHKLFNYDYAIVITTLTRATNLVFPGLLGRSKLTQLN